MGNTYVCYDLDRGEQIQAYGGYQRVGWNCMGLRVQKELRFNLCVAPSDIQYLYIRRNNEYRGVIHGTSQTAMWRQGIGFRCRHE